MNLNVKKIGSYENDNKTIFDGGNLIFAMADKPHIYRLSDYHFLIYRFNKARAGHRPTKAVVFYFCSNSEQYTKQCLYLRYETLLGHIQAQAERAATAATAATAANQLSVCRQSATRAIVQS